MLAAVAVASGSAGCVHPYAAPWQPPYGYPVQYPPQPADKSRPPFTDNRSTADPSVVQAQHQAAAAPPVPATPAPPAPASTPLPMPATAPPNPHVRTTPTAGGQALNLAPGELPIDRALELTKRIDECSAVNRYLQDRIRTMEAKAEAREQAINESLREVQVASDDVARARNEMRAVRKEIDGLRDRVKQVEAEEAETLKIVIDALEKLIKQEEQP
jgi:hypothetical protein